eukprot:gene7869-1076_t
MELVATSNGTTESQEEPSESPSQVDMAAALLEMIPGVIKSSKDTANQSKNNDKIKNDDKQGTDTEELSKNAGNLSNDSDNESMETQNPSSGTENLITETQNLIQEAQNLSTEAQNLSTEAQNLSTEAQNLSTEAQNLSTAAENLSTETQNLIKNADNLSKGSDNVSTETQNPSTVTQNLIKETENLSTVTRNLSKETENLSKDSDNESTETQNPSADTEKPSKETENKSKESQGEVSSSAELPSGTDVLKPQQKQKQPEKKLEKPTLQNQPEREVAEKQPQQKQLEKQLEEQPEKKLEKQSEKKEVAEKQPQQMQLEKQLEEQPEKKLEKQSEKKEVVEKQPQQMQLEKQLEEQPEREVAEKFYEALLAANTLARAAGSMVSTWTAPKLPQVNTKDLKIMRILLPSDATIVDTPLTKATAGVSGGLGQEQAQSEEQNAFIPPPWQWWPINKGSALEDFEAAQAVTAATALEEQTKSAKKDISIPLPWATGGVSFLNLWGSNDEDAIESPESATLCPSEWFVVDEASTNTRTFVIQGSDSIDHWKMNFAFDPVWFEEPELGVKVHRGVYEAAEVMYKRFLPLVTEHVEASPLAKVSFTGHSIGGSLATLLLFMYVKRGVLQEQCISNVYTFGAPAVFLEGSGSIPLLYDENTPEEATQLAALQKKYSPSNGSQDVGDVDDSPVMGGQNVGDKDTLEQIRSIALAQDGSDVDDSLSKDCQGGGDVDDIPMGRQDGVDGGIQEQTKAVALALDSRLERPLCEQGPHSLVSLLGLSEGHVRNVMLANDFVPRATTCDYTPIADILYGMGAGLAEHCSLNLDGRKHLYAFIGRLMVMQADDELTFVMADEAHPMLPAKPGLWLINRDPNAVLPSMAVTLPAADPPMLVECETEPVDPMEYPPANPPPDASAGLRIPDFSKDNNKSTTTTITNPLAQLLKPSGVAALQPLAMPPPSGLYVPATVTEAVFELMDTPHPLETLANAGTSVGPWGSISRYHNPEHYTKALGRAILHMRKEEMGDMPSARASDPGQTRPIFVTDVKAWKEGISDRRSWDSSDGGMVLPLYDDNHPM